MLKKSWVIAANSTKVRVFNLTNNFQLIELDCFVHPQSRMRVQDLVSDRRGSANSRFGHGTTDKEPTTEPRKVEAISFAKDVAHFLESERLKGEFERLYVAASPHFLGILRNELTPGTASSIEKHVDKDITHLKPEEICHYFDIR